MKFDIHQTSAVLNCVNNKMHILTGAAGTGKTTIIKEIIEDLLEKNINPILLAPTGKASARLREVTEYDKCMTIHSYLGFNGKYYTFPNKEGFLIIDESSMIDSELLALLLSTKPKKLILAGDPSQVPPVGNGAPFHILIDLLPGKVSKLVTCYRAKAAIHEAANLIRNGKMPSEKKSSGGESWELRLTGSPAQTMEKLIELLKEIDYNPSLDFILCPIYKGVCGIDRINEALVKIYNPRKDGNYKGFMAGDRILCLKNFNDLNLFNGDMGIVTGVSEKSMWIQPDRGFDEIELDVKQQASITFGYCISVHKSQGSQARNVVFVCLKNDQHMLTRALIYTGVTRAKKSCTVIGSKKTFAWGLDKSRRRETVLEYLAIDAAEKEMF